MLASISLMSYAIFFWLAMMTSHTIYVYICTYVYIYIKSHLNIAKSKSTGRWYIHEIVSIVWFKATPRKNLKRLFYKDSALIKLPRPVSYMKFQNNKNKLRRPFAAYADFECTLQATNDPKLIHKHVPNSCCYYCVCYIDNSRSKIRIVTILDAMTVTQ